MGEEERNRGKRQNKKVFDCVPKVGSITRTPTQKHRRWSNIFTCVVKYLPPSTVLLHWYFDDLLNVPYMRVPGFEKKGAFENNQIKKNSTSTYSEFVYNIAKNKKPKIKGKTIWRNK